MSNKKYTYDNGRTRKDRVNVWQLEKRVKKLEAQIQIISRHVNHQAGLNQQQVLLNESLHDRVALLEKQAGTSKGCLVVG